MEKIFTDRQIIQYLDRIGWRDRTELTLPCLTELQRLHLLSVPYENLDLLNGVPLSLTPDDLFRKIIMNRRGGFCFELQGMFCFLLKSMGFSVTQYAGRFMDEPGTVQMRRHRILVIDLNGRRYYCDVGVRSESSRRPLELVEGLVQSDGISAYCFRKDPFYGWVLRQKETGKPWKDILGFTEEPQIDDDYVMPAFYCEKHPCSTFNKFMKISLFTPDSDLTVVGNTFKVYRGARVAERRELRTDAEAAELLKNVFGIAVPESYRRFLFTPS
ncbi:MAG: arylamine N-acetyltransferase [Pyramidobacter sp.]|jgi:arylamine N-acetyltransferase